MRGGRRGGGRVGPNPNFPHWRPTYSLLLPTPSDSVLPVLTPAGPRHLDNAVRYLLNTTAMHSLGNEWIPSGSRASNTNTQATNRPLQRTASQGCSCRRAREKNWVRQAGRRQRSSISVDSDESGSGYGSTSSSRRALPSYSCCGPPHLLTNPTKEMIGLWASRSPSATWFFGFTNDGGLLPV